MKKPLKPDVGDYVKVAQGYGRKPWKGRVRRFNERMALIEWSYCGGLPTDICTWVFTTKLHVFVRTKRLVSCQMQETA